MTYLQEDEFNRYLEYYSKAPHITVDTEGTLNHPFAETWGLSTSYNGVSEYFAFNHLIGSNLPGEWLAKLVRVIETSPCLVFHHAKHDLRSLTKLGIKYTGKFYDTMLMAHMVNENLYSKELDALARTYGTTRKRNDELMKELIKAFGWSKIPVDIIRPYGAGDTFATEQIFDKILPDFQEQGFDGELWDWEQKFARLLAKIEDTGILIDQSFCEQELDRGLKIMEMIKKRLGIDPSKPTQLGKYLLEDLGLPPVGEKGKSGRYSFNKETMKIYDELLEISGKEDAKLILTFRGWQKTTSSNYKSYLEKLGPDGRIHCNYKQHGTDTSRLSCENPNLQNIPKASENDWNGNLKRAFISTPGRTRWTIDFAQLELRLGAAYGQEEKLIEVFNSEENRDIFSEMAEDMGWQRNAVKTLNYTTQYGGGAQRISRVFGVSIPAARALIDDYYRKYPGLRKATNLAAYRCVERGYVQYWTGRRRHFSNPTKQAHKAFNSVIQGGAFEIVKRGMVKGDEAGLFNDECKLDIQIHDEIGLDIENGKEDIYLKEWQRILEDTPEFGVKFKTEAKLWGQK